MIFRNKKPRLHLIFLVIFTADRLKSSLVFRSLELGDTARLWKDFAPEVMLVKDCFGTFSIHFQTWWYFRYLNHWWAGRIFKTFFVIWPSLDSFNNEVHTVLDSVDVCGLVYAETYISNALSPKLKFALPADVILHVVDLVVDNYSKAFTTVRIRLTGVYLLPPCMCIRSISRAMVAVMVAVMVAGKFVTGEEKTTRIYCMIANPNYIVKQNGPAAK